MMKNSLAVLALLMGTPVIFAADMPEAGTSDPRVRYVTYKKDDVTLINVKRGAVTRIVLGEEERILVAATGFSADCAKAEYEWCVHADTGTNQVWVKPKERATTNNLELKTDKRDYSFEFIVVGEADRTGVRRNDDDRPEANAMFRVIFRYPVELPKLSTITAMTTAGEQIRTEQREQALLQARLEESRNDTRNWKYSMQVLKGGEEIAPALVFDDGRFTYFRFPANREIPTIYYLSPSGEEARVNFHMQGDLAVVQRMGRQFVLRLGKAVVGVWNENFDSYGVPAKNGATVQGVERTLRQP